MKKYSNLDIFKSRAGVRYRTNPIYPNIPLSSEDFYIITSVGDRYDTLARQFYKDSSLWWIIASANNSQKASLVVEPGVQLRIPANKEQILELYRTVNKDR